MNYIYLTLASIALSVPSYTNTKNPFISPRTSTTLLKNLLRKEWASADLLLKSPTQILAIGEFALIFPENAHIVQAGHVYLPKEAEAQSNITVYYAFTKNRELLILSIETVEEMVCPWESVSKPVAIVAARYTIPKKVTIPEIITIEKLEKLCSTVSPDVYKTYDLERGTCV